MLSADVNAKEQAFVGGHRSIVALAQSLRLKGRSKNHALQRMMVAAKISSPGQTALSRLQPANIPIPPQINDAMSRQLPSICSILHINI
jgi:hypothetical protein